MTPLFQPTILKDALPLLLRANWLTCLVTKIGSFIRLHQDLQTHLNCKSDLTGNLAKMSINTSSGKPFTITLDISLFDCL